MIVIDWNAAVREHEIRRSDVARALPPDDQRLVHSGAELPVAGVVRLVLVEANRPVHEIDVAPLESTRLSSAEAFALQKPVKESPEQIAVRAHEPMIFVRVEDGVLHPARLRLGLRSGRLRAQGRQVRAGAPRQAELLRRGPRSGRQEAARRDNSDALSRARERSR